MPCNVVLSREVTGWCAAKVTGPRAVPPRISRENRGFRVGGGTGSRGPTVETLLGPIPCKIRGIWRGSGRDPARGVSRVGRVPGVGVRIVEALLDPILCKIQGV